MAAWLLASPRRRLSVQHLPRSAKADIRHGHCVSGTTLRLPLGRPCHSLPAPGQSVDPGLAVDALRSASLLATMTKEHAKPQPWDAESVKQELMRAIAAEAYCRELGRWGVGASGSVIDAAKRMEWLGFLEPEKRFTLSNWLLAFTRPSPDEKSDQVADARYEAALQEIAEQLNWSGQPRRLGFQRHKPGDERAGKRVPPRSRRRADDPSHGAVTREALDVASYIADVTAQLEAVAITAHLYRLASLLGMAKAESERIVRTINDPHQA